MTAPPPGPGEVRRTALPDTFDGIRFEIGRMVKYVQDARKDPLMVDFARQICVRYAKLVEHASELEGDRIPAHNNKTLYLEAIDLWCRDHFCYVNDPPNIEVIQTPRRMVRMTQIPREVIDKLMEPFYKAMEGAVDKLEMGKYESPPMVMGDCDEGSTLVCALAGCMDITPARFRFGGHDGTLHHVWSRVYADGNWYDIDITEPQYQMGDHSKFESYEEVDIPL